MTGSPGASPATISTRSPVRRPVRTRFSTARPFCDHEDLLDAGERHDGARRGHGDELAVGLRPRSRPRAKAPGRSRPCSVGDLGLDHQRAVLLADRGGQARHAAAVHRRIALHGQPHALALADRRPPRARAPRARRRSGSMRTSVATGAPAARYSPTEAWRALTAPSIGRPQRGVRELLPGQLELGAPLRRGSPGDCALPRSRPGSGPPRPGRWPPRCRARRAR